MGRAGLSCGGGWQKRRVSSSLWMQKTWGVVKADQRPGRHFPHPPAHAALASLTWWDADPGGPRTAPHQAALHLTGLICLLNMETTSSPPCPWAALRPVRLTLDVRPGGEICRADSHLHYSSWLFNRSGFACTAAWLRVASACFVVFFYFYIFTRRQIGSSPPARGTIQMFWFNLLEQPSDKSSSCFAKTQI